MANRQGFAAVVKLSTSNVPGVKKKSIAFRSPGMHMLTSEGQDGAGLGSRYQEAGGSVDPNYLVVGSQRGL